MRRYTQLTREQRYQIFALMKAGHNQSEIAMIVGRGKSTISRELGRNRGLRGYRPKQAHQLADARQQNRSRRRVTDETWSLVKQLLRQDWSPEQISGWLKREYGLSVSHEWIYQYVYALQVCIPCLLFLIQQESGREINIYPRQLSFNMSKNSFPKVLSQRI